ncbi:hypothetical protein IQ07DRAFT_600095 [Pyrenochaeta sp. DS3sAY3a]|nr:hypothetical protein IQ07DRAFT_600095 [Pyrenochaeta sp. DS3sAY3a]
MAQAPAGCSSSSPNPFQISTVNISSSATKRDLGDIQRRQLAGALTITLTDGVLKDQAGRQGYIASNYQFQFDAPVQDGARETSGFSLCSNGSLALGGSTVWYQCLSGTFYNLYSQAIREQDCIAIHIQAVNQGAGVSQITDGQPQATSAGPVISQITDGQPQATSPGAVVSQISDGQPQATAPGPVVSQISDGQPQATAPGPVVSQISDGQPQATAPAGPVVSQISDGQPQATAPAGPVVSQISDGQPQASAPAGPVVSQISDGQPQAPAPTGPVVSQISDGQPQAPAPTGNVTTPTLPAFTGAAASNGANLGAFAAGLMGLFALL